MASKFLSALLRNCQPQLVHPRIRLPVYSSIYQFIHRRLFVHSPVCPPVRQIVHQLTYQSVGLFVRLCVCLSVQLCTHPFIHPTVIHQSIRPFTLPPARLHVEPTISMHIGQSARLFVCPSVCPIPTHQSIQPYSRWSGRRCIWSGNFLPLAQIHVPIYASQHRCVFNIM